MISKFKNSSLALFLVRIGLAAVFIGHGWQKIANIEQTINFISSLGFPAFMGYFIAYLELVGGIIILLGIFSRWIGFLFAIEMSFAIYLVKLQKGFIGGYEFEFLILLCALAVMFAGPGRYSISRS